MRRAPRLAHVTFLVRQYDEAIEWFTTHLGFRLLEDTPLGGGKRWVLVAPGSNAHPALLLARATTAEQLAAVGRQAGGRVFLFLHTSNFWRDYNRYLKHGVRFVEAPRREAYGTVVVFEDLYGNRWDLVQRHDDPHAVAEEGAGGAAATMG